MKTVFFAATLFLVAAVAPAFAADDVCLRHHDVDGWGSHGDHAMVVNDRFGHKYLVSLAGLCNDLDYSFGMAIRSPVGMTFGCVERGDHIVMRGGGASRQSGPCWITKVERYTPDMEKAYKDALEAKKHEHAD